MKRKHYLIIEMMAVVLVFVIAVTVMLPRFLVAQNINTSAHFPDPIFRRFVEKIVGVEPEGRFTKQDLAAFKHLDIPFNSIQDFKGLKFFTGLTHLLIFSNVVESIDFSKQKNLIYLNCTGAKLSSINISQCRSLSLLICSNGALRELDVSNNPKLVRIQCNDNQLTSLDVSHNMLLQRLDCSGNPIQTLNVSNARLLDEISCSSANLRELDIASNINLTVLKCINNQLQTLDVSHNP